MIHLGDITKISGYEVPVVDCIIGGSPCQDLSVAGKRAGLEGERSGLFMEQIRIVKEMRERDARCGVPREFIRPRYMVWENVPGALSSGKPKGEDFRIVLEEILKIVEPEANVPMPEKNKWSYSGILLGDGWSVAWRVLDAQFWGTSSKPLPQRRRRIAIVADFGGQSAPEILFIRKSVSGNSEPGEPKRKETARDVGESVDATGSSGFPLGFRPENLILYDETATTLCNGTRPGFTVEVIQPVGYLIESQVDACIASGAENAEITDGNISPSLLARAGTGGNNVPIVAETFSQQAFGQYQESDVSSAIKQRDYKDATDLVVEPVVLDRAFFNKGQNAKYDPQFYEDGTVPTLVAKGPAAVCAGVDCRNAVEYPELNGTIQAKSSGGFSLNCNQVVRVKHVVRRLTPLECERLQGYPDGWTDIGEWVDSKGKKHKEADSPRYKALGNSIALPPWKWVLKRLCACYERDATMASLFDGIGGFPLIWEQLNGKGSCLWASEIEEFPMAVTKLRFGE